jgi:hypothetical protein
MARPAPTWQEQERAALDEFIVHRRRDFVGRGTLVQHLEAVALGTTGADAARGACVTGRPGSGKSAVFAQLHHRLTEGGQALVLANAAGATTHGSRVDAMLRRWIGELATRLAIADPIPDNATSDDVEAVFYRVLRQASHATRVAVLVDALNQFEATPRGTHATWFKPAQWPDNAALIATSLPCTAAEAVERTLSRLAAADPGHAGWQRDLWVSYWRLAQMAEPTNASEARDWWRKAYEHLSGMKQCGIMMPTDQQYLDQLRLKAQP